MSCVIVAAAGREEEKRICRTSELISHITWSCPRRTAPAIKTLRPARPPAQASEPSRYDAGPVRICAGDPAEASSAVSSGRRSRVITLAWCDPRS
jgi:hypothetical protein